MKKQSAEDYLDKLLNSVNSGEETEETQPLEWEEPEFVVDETKEDFLNTLMAEAEAVEKIDIDTAKKLEPEMYSRRVTKSEADFLAEFEAELENEDFDDFLTSFDEGLDSNFEKAVETVEKEEVKVSVPEVSPFEEETLVEEDFLLTEDLPAEEAPSFEEESPMALFGLTDPMESESQEQEVSEDDASPVMDSFDLGGVDLGALLNEATESAVQNEEPPVDDVFASLFGEDAVEEAPDLASMIPESSDSSDSIDLGNLGEADLMSLLAGEGGLSDLGDMLSQSDSSDVPMGGLDAFAAFAENEMASQSEPAPEENPKNKKKKKAPKEKGKGGFFDKIKEFLLSDDEEDDDEIELKQAKAPSADVLSDENEDILAQFEAEEKAEKDADAKKAKGGLFAKLKKDKKSKEEDSDKKNKKEKKEKKPKKQKAQKEKKPKVPKEKKPKKPKEVDTTPPLPRGPVILIWVMAISLFALVFLGTNLMGYSSAVSDAKSLYNTGNYAEAYTKLAGITIKEKDMEVYNQVATLATVDSELEAYAVFYAQEEHEKAFDSLICAAGRCELNEDNAEVYGCIAQMEILRKEVDNELSKYGMTYEQALEMYHIKDREDYTIALYTKLKELGLY